MAVSESRAQARAMPLLVASPRVLLGAMVGISISARSIVAWHHSVPRYFADEYIYTALARSIGHGHLTIHARPAHFPAILASVLAAPIWRLFPIETAYHLVQVENAVAASLAAIPIYALGRRLRLSAGYSLLCAAYGLVLPVLDLSVFTVTDFVAYPLALGALWAAVRALDRPTVRSQLLFVLLAGLATAARTQYFVLVPAYIISAAIIDRRAALRLHRTAALALAPAALAVLVAVTGYFRARAHHIPTSWRDLAQFALQLFLLTLVSGATIVPGAIVALWRAPSRPLRAFSAMFVSFGVFLVLEVSVFSANTIRFKERYLFGLLPLAALAFGVYRERGRPHRWPIFLMAVACAIAASRLPVSAYDTGAARYDSESLVAFEWLQGKLSVSSTSLFAAILMTVGVAWAVLISLRTKGRLALPVAIVFALAMSVIAAHVDLKTTKRIRHYLPADKEWVDHAAKGQPVATIATPLSRSGVLDEILFWNPQMEKVRLLDDADAPDLYADRQQKIAPSGALQDVSGYFFFDQEGSAARFTNARLVRRERYGELYFSRSAPRLRWLVEGMYQDGWLIAGGRIRGWKQNPAERGVGVRLSFVVSVPRDWPGIAIFRMTGRHWAVKPGIPRRIVCTSALSPLNFVYRTPSTIFDRTGRPASVRLSHLAVVDVPRSEAQRTSGCRSA